MVTNLKAMSLHSELFVGCALVLIFGTGPAAATEVFAPAEVMVENGTEVVLKCTFKLRRNLLFLTWTFLEEGSNPVLIFKNVMGTARPPYSSQFKDRLEWVGDLNKRDGSIKLTDMQFGDSGIYACAVVELPNFRPKTAHTRLRVVVKEDLPQTLTLGSVVEAVISAIIGLIGSSTPRDPG